MLLSEFISRVRTRANMENTQFVTDAEITIFVNDSLSELYDILVSSFEDYFSTTESFTLSGGTSYHALPSDFYKLRGVDISLGGNEYASLEPWSFSKRNIQNSGFMTLSTRTRSIGYFLAGSNLQLRPEGNSDGTFRMWYIPRVTMLVDLSDDAGNLMDYEDYIVVDAAIKCLIKEESDISLLQLAKDQLKSRITMMSKNRDAGSPKKVIDVTRIRDLEDNYYSRY